MNPFDLSRAAVDHAHQIHPTHCRPRPDLGHVRLPDLVRLGCFHTESSDAAAVPNDPKFTQGMSSDEQQILRDLNRPRNPPAP